MTIPKNTRKAKVAIANACSIRCYSLSNNFDGHPLVKDPVMWRGKDLVHVTPTEFLANELAMRHADLSVSEHGPIYRLHVHSNLWYEFTTHDWVLQPDDIRRCSSCGIGRVL